MDLEDFGHPFPSPPTMEDDSSSSALLRVCHLNNTEFYTPKRE